MPPIDSWLWLADSETGEQFTLFSFCGIINMVMLMRKGKKYWNIPSIIFNIVETLLLILMAYLLKIGLVNTLLVFFTFQISRFYFKMPKHYKAWQQCLIWTLLIFVSLFVVARVDITIGILATIFSAYILSGKADIGDMYMWNKGKTSKYQKLYDYIKYNGLSTELIEMENNLKNYDTQMYLVYKRRFREDKSFEAIREEFDLENPRINEILDKVYTLMTFNLKI